MLYAIAKGRPEGTATVPTSEITSEIQMTSEIQPAGAGGETTPQGEVTELPAAATRGGDRGDDLGNGHRSPSRRPPHVCYCLLLSAGNGHRSPSRRVDSTIGADVDL